MTREKRVGNYYKHSFDTIAPKAERTAKKKEQKAKYDAVDWDRLHKEAFAWTQRNKKK